MNIIEEIAREFLEENYTDSANTNYFLSGINSELSRHRKESDKVEFLTTIRNSIQEMHDTHYQNCRNKEDCSELKWHLKSLLYINNILLDHSISNDKTDWFTDNEKSIYSQKLDKILVEIETLKKGQEIIYDGVTDEIEELKNLYFIGKKNWKQLLAGKTVEMITAGIISETVSKELIKISDVAVQNLLQ